MYRIFYSGSVKLVLLKSLHGQTISQVLAAFQNNPQLLASYTQDTIFDYGQPAVKTSVPTLKSNPQPSVSFTSAIIVPANTQQVAKTLTDFSHYVGLFPTLKSAQDH